MINIIFEQRQITDEDRDDLALRNLYEEAFPEDEQIPWGSLVGLISEMNLDFTAYYTKICWLDLQSFIHQVDTTGFGILPYNLICEEKELVSRFSQL